MDEWRICSQVLSSFRRHRSVGVGEAIHLTGLPSLFLGVIDANVAVLDIATHMAAKNHGEDHTEQLDGRYTDKGGQDVNAVLLEVSVDLIGTFWQMLVN